MSVDVDKCNYGPDLVCIDSPTEVIDEENLLKMLEEKNKLVRNLCASHHDIFKTCFGTLS